LRTNRQSISILHELIKLVSASGVLLKEPLLAQCRESLQGEEASAWQSIVDAAEGTEGKSQDELTLFLVQARNNVGHHYYQPKALLEGYDHHFFGTAPSDLNDFAYASLGKNMEESRFFFADAAAQAYVRSVIDPTQILYFETSELIKRVNVAIRFFVHTYLLARRTELTAAKE
jgi:hypothetical protein